MNGIVSKMTSEALAMCAGYFLLAPQIYPSLWHGEAHWHLVQVSQWETPTGDRKWRSLSYFTSASLLTGPPWLGMPLHQWLLLLLESLCHAAPVCVVPGRVPSPYLFRHGGGNSSSQLLVLRYYCKIAFGFPKPYPLLCFLNSSQWPSLSVGSESCESSDTPGKAGSKLAGTRCYHPSGRGVSGQGSLPVLEHSLVMLKHPLVSGPSICPMGARRTGRDIWIYDSGCDFQPAPWDSHWCLPGSFRSESWGH